MQKQIFLNVNVPIYDEKINLSNSNSKPSTSSGPRYQTCSTGEKTRMVYKGVKGCVHIVSEIFLRTTRRCLRIWVIEDSKTIYANIKMMWGLLNDLNLKLRHANQVKQKTFSSNLNLYKIKLDLRNHSLMTSYNSIQFKIFI